MLSAKTLLLVAVMIFVSSCGDLFTREKDDEVSYNQFSICEMDSEAITKILTKNIKGDLDCLENNLYIFVAVVQSDKPGHLQRSTLVTYVKENFEDTTGQTVEILKAVFELNSLIFGGSKDYMSRDNIKKLTNLIKSLNEIVTDADIYKLFSTEEKISFNKHNQRKSKIYSAFLKIGKLISSKIIPNSNQIDLVGFIDMFKNLDNKDVLKYAKALLFVKKALVGGDQRILTSKELTRFMNLFADFGRIIYDFVDLPDTEALSYDEEEEILKLLKEGVQSTYKNFYYKNKPAEVIVTYEEIKSVVEIFFPDLLKYVNYKSSFLKAKDILLDSPSENFTASEINSLLTDILYKNFSRGVFIYRSFMNNQDLMESKDKILYGIEQLETFDEDEENFKLDFNRVIKDYRHFKGSSFSAAFGDDYLRNPKGIFDIMLYEDLLKRVFSYYGDESSQAVGDSVLSIEQLQKAMLDFAELLEGEDYILPGRSKSTAETISLMTSLFHAQSDGDSVIEIPEFTEFIITMTSSLSIAEMMYDYMKNICPVDEKDRVQASCYRANFSSFLGLQYNDDKQIKDFVPGLFKYFEELIENDPLQGINAKEEIRDYLQSAGKFSRLCSTYKNGEEVPMKLGDFIVSWAGLLAVEQTIMRFDRNLNGILEPREVDQVYKIFKKAVVGIIKGISPSATKYSKSFFQYIVKYSRVPDFNGSIWRKFRSGYGLLRFYFYENKRASADRMTFASVLEIIADNSPERNEKPYNCDLLR